MSYLWSDRNPFSESMDDLILGDESDGFMTCEEEDEDIERANAYARRLAEEEAEEYRRGNYYIVGETRQPMRFDDGLFDDAVQW